MHDLLKRAAELANGMPPESFSIIHELIAEVERLRSFEEFSKKLITLWIYMADAEEVLQNHRMRILEISQNMIDEQSSKIAAKDARIKEMGAEITAWVADRDSWIARYEAVRKEKDARIADQEAYIERLEAAFLEATKEIVYAIHEGRGQDRRR